MKSVVITGSSKGIGFGLAQEFLKRNYAVVVSSRSQADVNEVQKKFAHTFGADRVIGRACNVTDITQVQKLWDYAVQAFSKVDIWINNAALVNARHRVWEIDSEEIKNVVTTNLVGHMYGCCVAVKGMLSQGFGQIYNSYGFGSGDEKKPEGMSIYATTKRGIRYLTEVLIEDLKDTPVQIGSLMPGTVITGLILKTIQTMPEQEREGIKKIFNIVADTVETVAPFLVDEMIKNDKHGTAVSWMTEEKFKARLQDPVYRNRDLFSELHV